MKENQYSEIPRSSSVGFSVLMSVYYKENADYFCAAMDSVLNQTLPPNEIVLVKDGPLTEELNSAILHYNTLHPGLFQILSFEKNMGLGNALREGVKACNYELIARMDTDDLCVSNRFELQIARMLEKPELDVLGGDIQEFSKNPDTVLSYRIVPKTDEEIKRFLKKRNPFNHMTVMFRRASVLNAGNYSAETRYYEDYYLWTRMCLKGCTFENLGRVLVKVRAGEAMVARRGGWEMYQCDRRLSQYKYQNGLVNLPTHLFNLTVRFVVFVLLPDSARKLIYQGFLRKADPKGMGHAA